MSIIRWLINAQNNACFCVRLIVLLLAGVIVQTAASLTIDTPAFAAKDLDFSFKNVYQARPEVGHLVEKAQQFLKQHMYHSALGTLSKTAALPNKTAYETFLIEETRASAYVVLKKERQAINSLEESLATGILPRVAARHHEYDLVELSYHIGDPTRVITHGENYYHLGGKDKTPHLLMAEAYFQLHEYAAAAQLANAVIRQDETMGRKPTENTLRLLMLCEYKLKNNNGYQGALAQFLESYPTPSNWKFVLAYARVTLSPDDPLSLFVDQLMRSTGTITTASSYMNAAQLALFLNRPTEAKNILDYGYAQHVLGQSGNIGRQKRLYTMVSRRYLKETAHLPQFTADADASPKGNKLIALGRIYAAEGEDSKAITAFEAGLAKGGLTNPDEARLALGIAYMDAGQLDRSIQTLKSDLKSKPTLALVARLWIIKAEDMRVSTETPRRTHKKSITRHVRPRSIASSDNADTPLELA